MDVSPRISLTSQGPEFSRIVYGMWRLNEWSLSIRERQELIEAALELGVTSFDHADIYGGYQSEELFGETLAAAPHLRKHMQLVSKCGIKLISSRRPEHRLKSYDTSFSHIVASAESSLRALRTEYLDLL